MERWNAIWPAQEVPARSSRDRGGEPPRGVGAIASSRPRSGIPRGCPPEVLQGYPPEVLQGYPPEVLQGYPPEVLQGYPPEVLQGCSPEVLQGCHWERRSRWTRPRSPTSWGLSRVGTRWRRTLGWSHPWPERRR